jgi:hypothetical protein
MADAIDQWALGSGLQAISIDGPQGWRDPGAKARPGVGRRCEFEARTPGKTGTYGQSYPGTYLGWVRFSIDVFEHLQRRSHVHIANDPCGCVHRLPPGQYYVLECFPTSTWRASGLDPLPGHASAPPSVVRRYAQALWNRFGLPDWARLDHHDHLQAVVAALPAAALLGGPCVAIPRGESARVTDGSDALPRHVVEGLIWDAQPVDAASPGATFGDFAAADEAARDCDNPLLPDDRHLQGEEAIQRGVELFRELARLANGGAAVGIGYAQFACLLHGAGSFEQLIGRQYLPSDSTAVIGLAHKVTAAAGGRTAVTRGDTTIQAGMDTFIWSVQPPFDRPAKAWTSHWGKLPYTPEEWRRVFPEGVRRLYR